MLAPISRDPIARLFCTGLTTARHETAGAGGVTTRVKRYRITNADRLALEGGRLVSSIRRAERRLPTTYVRSLGSRSESVPHRGGAIGAQRESGTDDLGAKSGSERIWPKSRSPDGQSVRMTS